MANEKQIMVTALDFGTTYSGYAFSMRHEFKIDPLIIHANQAWNSGGRALLSLKTPTCLLLNNNKEFVAFGYEAENRYADILLEDEQNDYYYFYHFKMNLHNNKNISTELSLKDLSGKSLPAVDVFSMSIRALVNHLMDLLETRGTGVKMEEIQWVLTVPAIWTDSAKQFMRKSSEKAGIPSESLLLALEPEAASIFCQYLPTEKSERTWEGFRASETGTKYMVVDLGGGTADITVHEKMEDGKLRELHRATGNDCGGTSVDKNFFQLLGKIFGDEFMKALENGNPSAYLDLSREFETVKRTIDSSKSGTININIPYATVDGLCRRICKGDLLSVTESSIYSNKISLRGDKMKVNADVMRGLFQPTIDRIIIVIKDILESHSSKEVKLILLVGGFAECQLIKEAIRKAFSDMRIIIPDESALSVLKGAVLFGHRPDYIHTRVMRFSYGVDCMEDFNLQKHDIKNFVVVEGVEKCDKCFSKIVGKDEAVKAGTKVKKSFYTVYKNQKYMNLPVYVSIMKDPRYTDADGCSLLGKANVEIKHPSEEKRWVDMDFIIGNTEIGMNAVDRESGNTVTAKFKLN